MARRQSITGHISQASLPEFDPDSSSGTWYQDYVAYCGISDDGRKLSAAVTQLGRRKPILKKPWAKLPTTKPQSARRRAGNVLPQE
jgi:hypothetical protein